jgi:hypothetical protein
VPDAAPPIVLARKVLPVSAASVETRSRAWIATEALLGKLRRPVSRQQALGFDAPLFAAEKQLAPAAECNRGE